MTISAQLSGIGAQRPLGGFLPAGMYFKNSLSKTTGFESEAQKQKSPASAGLFISAPVLAAKPGVYSGCAVLFFPGFQPAVVTAFGFNQFTGMRVVINLHNTGFALFRGRRNL